MMEEKNKEKVVIDLKKIVRAIKCNKLLYAKVLSVVFVLSCIYIYSVPRFYTCNVKLAPEIENSSSAGTLSSLASSVLGTSNILSTDAISPNLYPDLTNSNDFIVSLFPIRVTIKEQDLHTNYYDYLSQYQKKAWWVSLVYKIIGKKEPKLAANVDPFRLTKAQSHIANMIKDNVIVVDAGVTIKEGKTYGDADFDNIKDKCLYITPCIGGVGPMTIAMLLENVIEAYERKNKNG
jgi:hypothetical protein